MKHAILLSLLLSPTLLLSCQPAEETHLQVVLYSYKNLDVPKLDQSNLLSAESPANEIEMVLVNLEGAPEVEKLSSVALSEQRATFEQLPYDTPFRLLARGLYTDPSGASSLQFYGASSIFEVKEGEDQTVTFQVGRVNCVSLNRGSNYISDPALNEDTHFARVGGTSTRLSDGRVVLVGGGNVGYDGELTEVYNTVEIYEPSSSRFTLSKTTLLQGRAYHTATLLPNDEILLVGGVSGIMNGAAQVMSSASLLRFNEAGEALIEPLSVTDPLLSYEFARYHHQAVKLLGDNSVLIVGGFDANGLPLASTLRYFPESRVFLPQRPLQDPRARFAGESYGNSHAVFAGGLGEGGVVLDSIEVFVNNPSHSCADGSNPSVEVGCFIRLPEARLPVGRWGLASVLIDDGNQVLFMGGHPDTEGLQGYQQVEIFNSQFSSITPEAGWLPGQQGRFQATLLKEGSVLVTGGMLGDNLYNVGARLQADVTDPATGLSTHFTTYTLESCGLSEPRAAHNAVLLQHGVVLITGGFTGRAGFLAPSRRVELYFPSPIEMSRFYAP